MPPWHARLHLGSPSNRPSTSKSSNPRNLSPDHHLNGDYIPDPPLHGVPLLPAAPSTSLKTPQNPQHSRSHSHPFPSLFASNKPSVRDSDDLDTNYVQNAPISLNGLLPGSRPRTGVAVTPQMTKTRVGEQETLSCRCHTCDSSIRYPRRATTLGCPVCSMVIDLQSVSPGSEESGPKEVPEINRFQQTSLKASMSQRVPPISLEKTRSLIEECLVSFMGSEDYVENINHPLPQASTYNNTIDISSPTLAGQAKFLFFPKRKSVASPQSQASSVPSRHPLQPSDQSIEEDFSKVRADPSHSMFRNLETYIRTCFAHVDCLNSSFLTASPPPVARAASESKIVSRCVSVRSDDQLNEASPFPELDAKTLLLGDFAENGTWWAGKSTPLQGHRPQTARGQQEKPSDRVIAKSPRIDWVELNEWYNILFSLHHSSQVRLQEIQAPNVLANSERSNPSTSIPHRRYVNQCLVESCAHVHRTLFKATEALLRHPGRHLKSPLDCRFLFILLANPYLSVSEKSQPSPIKDGVLGSPQRSIDQGDPCLLQLPPINPRPTSSGFRRSPGVSGTSLKHSSIVKRILGIMSNLSPECHFHLANWFSRLSEDQMRRLVDLVGSFVSYRLTRQTRRNRSNSHDPTEGGLIPSMSGPGAGTSAHLHAAIGISATGKSLDKTLDGTLYGDDWQVKAAAKVMSLLFLANDRIPGTQHGGHGANYQENTRMRTISSSSRRTYRIGQGLPTNAFYNTMLDYSDLVADFETWESRRGKFSFCQYPMFLSIWAKIRIMEHDARRQMEIKAREAFFNSIMNRKAINQYLILKVRRQCLVEDSLKGVSEVVGTGQEEIKKGLRIEFLGEEGLDSGGLRKEWFLLLVREVFDVEHGLFVYDDDSRYCYFNPNGFETSDQFFLVGVLLGLAIYNSTILDVALPPFAFRKLLASAPNYTGLTTSSSRPAYNHTLEDLAEFRPSLANGLKELLEYEGNVEDTFMLDFVAVTERFGQVQNMPLCTNGEMRTVTNSNCKEYVDLYVRYLLDTAVSRQYEPFKRGFFTVCGGNALSLFRPEEIELLVRGSDEPLDVAILKAVAIYDSWGKDVEPADEPQVLWFWDAFTRASPKDQRKLLSFITASDRIPAMGATSLVIKIVCVGGEADRYPIARTCFNMIGLHRYKSQITLEDRLWRAVAEGEGFGMK